MKYDKLNLTWAELIEKAVDHIEKNLNEKIDCNAIAGHIYSSAYHFQRIFFLVLEEAYALEYPFAVSRAAELPGPLFLQKYGSVFAETVKPAEDGRGVIVRLYEGYGNEETEEIFPAARFGSFWETNILEERIHTIALREGALRLIFRPFEVKTLLFSEEKE